MIVVTRSLPAEDEENPTEMVVPLGVEAAGGQVDVHVDPGKVATETLSMEPSDAWRFIKEFTRALVAAEEQVRAGA